MWLIKLIILKSIHFTILRCLSQPKTVKSHRTWGDKYCLSAIGLIDKKSIRGITDEPLRPRTSSSLVRIRLSRSDIRLSRTSTTAPFSLTAIFVFNTFLRPRRNSGSFNYFSGYFIYDSYIPTITSYKPHRTI